MKKIMFMFLIIESIIVIGCSQNNNEYSNEKNIDKNTSINKNIYLKNNYIFKKSISHSLKIHRNEWSANNGDYIVFYPSIAGIKNKKDEEIINKIIKNEFFSYIDINNTPKDSYCHIDYEIKVLNENYLSIACSYDTFSKGAPYPNNNFFTLNIDLINKNKIFLKDTLNIDKDLIKILKTVLNTPINDEMKSYLYKYLIETNSDNDFINMLKTADMDYKTYSYFTENSLGISIEMPHSAGDHLEVEIPLNILK